MRNLRILAALGLLTTAAAANAGVSSTWTLTSDYDYRGITQTDEDPALQASLDFAADNGWYVGAWASNVDFGTDVDYEVDLYTGFTGETEGGLGWDVGLVYYAYPDDSDLDYPEIYGSLSYQWFKGKLWYSNDFGATSESSFYLDTSATVPLPANFSLLAHIGYSDGDAIDVLYGDSYMDYSLGVGYEIGNFSLSLKYVDTDIEDAETDRVIFTVATTFPWGKD
ncbi:uncharacterized protein (TIGR02001 family) [Povalibacter uvarum]|uniref:Uncharacterized protein (TIGR02001 family) n=1 Tax=Povalibacter uvarum TaxID=732238 RepID=A0A841HUY5_9GAMM|nr:TorF family putative porin [Povalibacter uvarum]MBB6095782.1 uncharacterized protein (TIGR02001 family) [Povalibacter uvarum]